MKKADGLNTALAKTVKSLREEKKLTQEELAELCGTSAVYISELERGIKMPTLNTVYVLAAALNLPAASLVSKIDNAIK